ncbi:MAG: tRNA glutamyl-Q(34) synthetase GluQRS [Pseudomonadota bacterium]|nr:tRNA glutamyl-Q(34) synthetase GluQRS [Pseudomonadota bacterium]
MHYRGRFAPSPTGPLHFGSVVAALASYLDARHHQGKWLVRIDDLDTLRERPGSATQILTTLEHFGMHWDEEIVYQSQHLRLYQQALAELQNNGLVYGCNCSRKHITAIATAGIEGFIYPGVCRDRSINQSESHSLRLRTNNLDTHFDDRIHGAITQRIESEVGDFLIRRGDGIFAYQLAVAVDDHEQGITDIVRGEDLLFSTPRQIYLQQLLKIPRPAYMHLPLVTNADGSKLSKSSDAWPVDTSNPVKTLNLALKFLGQQQVLSDSVEEFWPLAIRQWDIDAIKRVMNHR